ncbi:GxxExxY protein [Stieleria sp.]|uniref:GxxExxY protein n=1 Tax=Stieleria sp. TaxID=2795976 RepID=UPI00356967DB
MPVEVLGEVRAVEEQVFADVCYRVMGRVFSVRKTMGPFFREKIYQTKICESFQQTQVEVPIVIRQDRFRHEYFIDTVFDAVAVFEWKAVERLHSRHRAQLLNYLMLCELQRGKLVNLRPETIRLHRKSHCTQQTKTILPEKHPPISSLRGDSCRTVAQHRQ